ncbi:MAG TPA: ChpI protein [Actinobacteria bacterium]|nr:ChpI protein [Actinomycetota bacterium]
MKTAISLPDALYERAENVAGGLGIARSHLYARAIEEFLDRYEGKRVTAALDALYGNEPERPDPWVENAAASALLRVEW